MNNSFSPMASQAEMLVAIRKKGLKSQFEIRNNHELLVAQLDWEGVFHWGAAKGSWTGGEIQFKRKSWFSADLEYQLSGSTETGQMPFSWRHFNHSLIWGHERFQLKSKGWFLRRFQLFDANEQLLADFSIRERFISFKIEINPENRLYKYAQPEAILLAALYILITRVQNARRAAS